MADERAASGAVDGVADGAADSAAAGAAHPADRPGADEAGSFRETVERTLDEALRQPGWEAVAGAADEGARRRLVALAEAIVEENRSINLTAITDAREVALKHLVDSLSAFMAASWPPGARVCDIGTGAGLPGLALAAVRTDLQVTLVDSVAKKLAAVDRIAARTGVAARTAHGRAEELAHDRSLREAFDIVTARAVARFAVLAELTLPFCRVGGWLVALKGPDADPEIQEGARALKLLGGSPPRTLALQLPLDAGVRTIVAVQKVAPTPPAYPRRPGVPARKPLL